MFDLKINRPLQKILLAATLTMVSAFAAPAFATDSVVLTFSSVGDSRQDPTGPDGSTYQAAYLNQGNCAIPTGTGSNPNPGLTGQDCKWLQNTKAITKIMRTIQSQKANLLFFNGDMVMGYGKAGVPVTARTTTGTGETAIANPLVSDIVASDLMQFYQQYGFWRGMVATLMETGTYVVPVPGNHEVQCKRCGKKAQIENETAWKDNMGDLILDQTRLNNLLPANAGTLANWNVNNAPAINYVGMTGYDSTKDIITTNQSQLSYSFDIGKNHFVVINTDPVGKDSHAPTAWLSNDLATAKTNGATHFFVFGHKPAYYYSYTGSAPSSSSSLNLADSVAANAFWTVINNYNATYFSGHEHIYNVTQPSGTGTSYQVIVGAGGSPFEDFESTPVASPQVAPTSSLATDRLYSWATVSIYQSGKVVMNTYGFDETMAKPVQQLGSFTLATQ